MRIRAYWRICATSQRWQPQRHGEGQLNGKIAVDSEPQMVAAIAAKLQWKLMNQHPKEGQRRWIRVRRLISHRESRIAQPLAVRMLDAGTEDSYLAEVFLVKVQANDEHRLHEGRKGIDVEPLDARF